MTYAHREIITFCVGMSKPPIQPIKYLALKIRDLIPDQIKHRGSLAELKKIHKILMAN